MKIQQIENDKIQIILSKEDLDCNKISLHSFMANSNQTQQLFLEVLDFAEKEIGFKTNNYDIAIETLVIDNSNFVLTITRLKKYKDYEIKRLKFTRKNYNHTNTYKFDNFNDFYEFFKLVKFSTDYVKSLFYFNDSFYYIYNKNLKSSSKNSKIILPEFAKPSRLPCDFIKNFGKQIY